MIATEFTVASSQLSLIAPARLNTRDLMIEGFLGQGP